MCGRPFRSESGVFGCGGCMPCLINRRRMWTSRILLESRLHEFSSMVTLTYSEDFVPEELRPRDLQLFLKRLRKAYVRPLRFFAVGEYGDKTLRPHFHLALFGFSVLDRHFLDSAWRFGFNHCAELNEKTAAYVAGYVTKKFGPVDERLKGKQPEFIRMSNRPGIGNGAARLMAAELVKRSGRARVVAEAGDVPYEIRVGNGKLPLGRYMREALREEVGWSKGCPVSIRRKLSLDRSLMSGEDLDKENRRRKGSVARAESRVRLDLSKRTLR